MASSTSTQKQVIISKNDQKDFLTECVDIVLEYIQALRKSKGISLILGEIDEE